MTALKNVRNYFPVANHRIFTAGLRNLKLSQGLRSQTIDSACLAANLVCHLTGLAETFYSLSNERHEKLSIS